MRFSFFSIVKHVFFLSFLLFLFSGCYIDLQTANYIYNGPYNALINITVDTDGTNDFNLNKLNVLSVS